MSIILDQEAHQRLAKLIGRRLRAARIASRLSEQEVADALGYKGATQVCLTEKGEGRIPPIIMANRYCDLYGISLDFMAGRIDDPISDPVETNQGAIKRAVINSIECSVQQFVDAVSSLTVASVSEHMADRGELRQIVERIGEVSAAYQRVKELNPMYEEDIKGSFRLESAIEALAASVSGIAQRMDSQQRLREIVATGISLDPEKFALTPTFDT